MQNPWLNLPGGAPFIAPADRPFIDGPAFARLQSWYDFNLFPDPFVGNFDTALVIFLSNNPRISDGDYRNLQSQMFLKESLKNIRRIPDATFFYWHDELTTLDGHGYWQNLLGKTARLEGIGKQQLLRNMMQIEVIGYHSEYYKPLTKLVLPTQEYSFWLVREAISSGKLIVVMRGKRHWFKYVPELQSYENTLLISNNLNPTISRNNLAKLNAPGSYERLINALKS